MLRKIGRGRDPFWDDGVGARHRNRRVVLESVVACGIAIVACGLVAALWLRALAPLVGSVLPH
jgi:hypothetical protein